MNRRHLIAALPAAALAGAAQAAPFGSFNEGSVQAMARDLARRPYRAPSKDLPPALSNLSYDDYRNIRFRPAKAQWKPENLPFNLQFFHRGGLFRERVDLYEVRDGRAAPIAYSTADFDFKHGAPTGLPADLGFAGFRIHAPLNRPDYYDEVGVFLGASYFRGVAKGMLYGLSARGLAIGAGGQEEFPAFRSFWIERPKAGARSLTVHALLDSPSCAGAFRFVITPGETTVFDTTARIFPRKAIANVGIAPLTSMFLFGGDAARRFDDFRPQVHDSDGLVIAKADGQRVWRPLSNPAAVSLTAYPAASPKGFGLIQRERRFEAYEDLEANYHQRPSAWVEPKAGFVAGEVRLVELPAGTEYEDNIVASWTPTVALKPGVPANFAYRLHWGPEPSANGLGKVVQTRAGAASIAGHRRFVLDFGLPAGIASADALTAKVSSSAGQVLDINLHPNPEARGARLSFELDPAQARAADLSVVLLKSGTPCSELWLYRWIA